VNINIGPPIWIIPGISPGAALDAKQVGLAG
jgi:hypothetical protein